MNPIALEQPEVRSQRAAIRRAAVMQPIRIARLALQSVMPRSCKWLRLWGRNCDKVKGMLCNRIPQPARARPTDPLAAANVKEALKNRYEH